MCVSLCQMGGCVSVRLFVYSFVRLCAPVCSIVCSCGYSVVRVCVCPTNDLFVFLYVMCVFGWCYFQEEFGCF